MVRIVWFSIVVSRRVNTGVFALLACVAGVLSVYLMAPGWMAVDSGAQLEQARRFAFRDDHPVMMALIWHYTDRVVPGPLGLLMLMHGLYWVGLGTFFGALPGPLLPRIVAFLLVAVHPPSSSSLPVVWKDTLMQGALMAGAACLVLPGRRWLGARYGVALVLLVVAIGSRHNAAAAVWPFLALPLIGHPRLQALRLRWRWAIAVPLALAATLGLTIGLGKALSPVSERTEFWQTVPVFDLAGMSLASGELLVDAEAGVLTPGMGVREIRYKYNPQWMNSLYYCLPFAGKRCVPLFRRVFEQEKLAHLVRNWWSAIITHPAAYLAHRAKVSKAVLAIAGGAPGIYYSGGEPFTHFGREYPATPRALRLMAWIDRQVPTFWFRPWLYLGLCTALLPIAVALHARGGSPLPVALSLSGLSYMVGVLITAGSSDYRYSVWTILCSMLCLATIVLSRCVETVRGASAAGSGAARGVRFSSSPL